MNFKVLDHGYVNFVEAWGTDERIIEAARMSTGKGFIEWGPRCICGMTEADLERANTRSEMTPQCAHDFKAGDEKLLRYLYENKHDTPFEMAGMVIEVQAPIFVFREWHRHRTQSYNEASARYSPLPDLNYMPTVERLMINSKGSNKQAGTIAGAEELTEDGAKDFLEQLEHSYTRAESLYQTALEMGIPKELARVHLPVGRYSRMRATANLRNWLGFLTLRSAPNAQYEIRVYAEAVGHTLRMLFPRTMELFYAGR